jgi:ferric-dicitrate binding protein FerR (iron transport regulator)
MERLNFLFPKYLSGSLDEAEFTEFWQLLEQGDKLQQLSPELQKLWASEPQFSLTDREWEKKFKALKAERSPKQKGIPWYRYAAAAVLVLMLGSAALFYFKHQPQENLPVAKIANPAFKNDVLPGVTGATLTLADGKVIALDSKGNGLLAQQSGTEILAKDGSVVYNGINTNEKPEYNTLTTRNGQQFPVRLSDGSLVVLDAGSTITYPVAFKGDKRVVDINGRFWLEIAKDPNRPFFVRKGDKQVQVFGTHFNVSAYDDEEDMKVTLVEGSVKVSNGNVTSMLKPGQQALMAKNNNGIKVVENADVEQAIAWKNGLFDYKSGDITQVMRDAARWYDIEVVYEGGKPADTFTGGINRTATLTELLSILQMSRVHFKLEGRKLTVLSK